MPRVDRDWSTLRTREWQPVGTSTAKAGVSEEFGGGGASSSGGGRSAAKKSGGRGGAPGAAETGGATNGWAAGGGAPGTWRTDTEISRNKKGDVQPGKKLERWQASELGGEAPIGTLEELTKSDGKSIRGWDQFKANAELFGVVSTYKSDLSQYTTPLDPSRVPIELRRRAERVAADIEKSGGTKIHDGCGSDGEDEEALYSAVPRNGRSYAGNEADWSASCWDDAAWAEEGWADDDWGDGYNGLGASVGTWTAKTGNKGGGSAEAGAAGAIMALISTSGGGATSSKGGSGGTPTSWRDRVGPQVRDWWRCRRAAGFGVPAGAEDALVCPFSERVFGDLTQLVAHWAAAIPRADGPENEKSTPSSAATENFRRVGSELRWCELMDVMDLGETFSVDAPRPGSVWENVMLHVSKSRRGKAQADAADAADAGADPASSVSALSRRYVNDYVVAAVQIKCWQRDKKVEHREVLEGIASAIALHLLADNPGNGPVPWSSADGGSDARQYGPHALAHRLAPAASDPSAATAAPDAPGPSAPPDAPGASGPNAATNASDASDPTAATGAPDASGPSVVTTAPDASGPGAAPAAPKASDSGALAAAPDASDSGAATAATVASDASVAAAEVEPQCKGDGPPASGGVTSAEKQPAVADTEAKVDGGEGVVSPPAEL